MNMPYIPEMPNPRHDKTKIIGVIVIITLFVLFVWIGKGCAEEINIPIIIRIESAGNPDAISQDNCRGLMQVSEIVLKEYNHIFRQVHPYTSSDLYDPEINIRIGIWYITECIPQMLKALKIPDTIDNRLIAYNWGIGNLRKWFFGGADYNKLPKETRNYLKKYHALIGKHK